MQAAGSKTSKHLRTAGVLKRRIGKGVYLPGSKLPPVRLLSAELGVSTNVVQRALRVLEMAGIVQTSRGVGVRVLDDESARRTPLLFGLVYPFGTDTQFAGAIHRMTESAIDVRRNYCIIKSSGNDPAQERELVEQFLDNGIEGLLVWPCEGSENAEFFREIADRAPVVLVDRTFDNLNAASVALDYAGMGRDIVLHLAQKGFRNVLMLESPQEISSYKEMHAAMRETVRQANAENRFRFVQLRVDDFLNEYPRRPDQAVEAYRSILEDLLTTNNAQAMFCAQDEFIDHVYANTDLVETHPLDEIISTTNTFPGRRSRAFYRLSVLEWVCNFEGMIRRASDLLHDRVVLKSRVKRNIRIKLRSVVRTREFQVTPFYCNGCSRSYK